MELPSMRCSPKLLFAGVFPLLLVLIPPNGSSQSPVQAAGVKMTVRTTIDGMSSELTEYFQGDRKRLEYRNATGGAKRPDGSIDWRYGPRIASITRCDLGKMYELNLDAREYHGARYPPQPFTKEQMNAMGIKPQGDLPLTPTLLMEIATRDTGERKEMFGHTARHVIRTRKETPLEGSHSQPQETAEDGWFIDLDNQISCDRKWRGGGRAHAFVAARLGNGNAPPELPKFVEVGKQETGFAVQSRMTTRGVYVLPDGTKKDSTSTFETAVTLLEEGPLDPALFEIPAGFREVAHVETNPPLDWQTAWANAWVRFKARVERLFY
jgi:hypothetical protein